MPPSFWYRITTRTRTALRRGKEAYSVRMSTMATSTVSRADDTPGIGRRKRDHQLSNLFGSPPRFLDHKNSTTQPHCNRMTRRAETMATQRVEDSEVFAPPMKKDRISIFISKHVCPLCVFSFKLHYLQKTHHKNI